MPPTDHLTKLTYLFDVLGDPNAPKRLKESIKDYLYSEKGLNRAMDALAEVRSNDVEFERLAEAAKPIAQASRTVAVIRALAREMPDRSTLRQALALALVAQRQFAADAYDASLVTATELSQDDLLGPSLYNTTLRLKPLLSEEEDADDARKTRFGLSSEGRALIHKVISHLRLHRDAD